MTTAFDQIFCATFHVIVIPGGGNGPTEVFVTDFSDLSVLDYIRYRTGVARVQHLSPADFEARSHVIFGARHVERREDRAHGSEIAGDSQVVDQISLIVRECIDAGASDIHFEPGEYHVRCRVRIDGALIEKYRLARETAAETLSRLKIMAGLDIAEKRRPQDGRIRFEHAGRTIDIRVSVIPTDFGEKAVLRLLDKETLRLDLPTLGLTPEQHTAFVRQIEAPHGIVLVTGPTGSGKTTTLYAALNHLRSPDVNICTVEDPIEYNLEGITQTQVRPDIDVTFARMLRSLLRQDPDIIMVGEIRDRETLDIAVRASMTGHLVLSTLHTNSALSTVARLVDMGAEPFLVAASLRMVVAQRLLRRNCPECFASGLNSIEMDAAQRLSMKCHPGTGLGRGCSACSGTGFQGRVAVYELLVVEDSLREAIVRRAPEHDLRVIARTTGYCPMAETAQELISKGITTPGEVLRETQL